MNFTLKRTDTGDILTLHPQFYWADEYDWTPLAQSEPVYTLTGAMDIQQGVKQAGRPITLKGDQALISRGDVMALQLWATVPELQLVLTHPKGQSYNVIFSRPFVSDITEIKAFRPIDTEESDKLQCTIHLLMI